MTSEQIDKLWNRALAESVAAGEEFTRYRFAAMVESAAVRRCVDVINAWANDSDRHEHMLADIEQEFPGAFE